MSNVRRLPLVPLAVPVQLVLALPLGIAAGKRKRRRHERIWPAPIGALALRKTA